jgi:hypothetical protein
MADEKITQLTQVTSLSDSDLFVVVVNPGTSPVTKAIKKSNAFSSSGGVPVARVMSTANVALATALENGDTLNGVTLATGDTVLLAFQTAAAENGLYTVVASGTASRHSSYATWASLVGLTVAVAEGTAYADTMWLCKANSGGTLGTTAVNFKPMNLQSWSAEYLTYLSVADSGGTVIPYDDTIPQVTEGTQILTLTVTPMTDTIEIETGVSISFGVNDGRGAVAIFKDGAANAIAASPAFIANSYLVGAPVMCVKRVSSLTPGTSTTITVRVGPGSGTGTLYINGNTAARKYGGVGVSWLKVREVNAGA